MEQKDIIAGFIQLGEIMHGSAINSPYLSNWKITPEQYENLQKIIHKQFHLNGWFTEESVRFSLQNHSEMLQREELERFVKNYSFTSLPKKVMVVMAGNLPLVGFHDFLCVLLSGHSIICKLSSDDQTLLPALIEILITIDSRFKERITLASGPVKSMDAVIATGSNNTLKYFEEYFGKYPHIFRKNRTSIAVLNGTETPEQIALLGRDIFHYFGLGCRNVSHLLLPKGFELNLLFENIIAYNEIINHHKYANNYDYNKAVHLLNQIPILENGFLLLKETTDLHASLAMVNYHYYENKDELESYLTEQKDNIQVIVGKEFTPFGDAQFPKISDFADNVDTMSFLSSL